MQTQPSNARLRVFAWLPSKIKTIFWPGTVVATYSSMVCLTPGCSMRIKLSASSNAAHGVQDIAQEDVSLFVVEAHQRVVIA